VLHSRSAKR